MVGLMLLSVVLLLDTVAGSSMPHSRSLIVGGHDAKPRQWPWMAYLKIGQNQTHYAACGGSLLNDRWLLSAAHCFKPNFRKDHSVAILGAYRLSKKSKNQATYSISKVIFLDTYTNVTRGDDIALVQLKQRVKFSSSVRPVRLPQARNSFSRSSNCMVTGWGNTKENVPLKKPLTLQEARVPIVPNRTCKKAYQQLSSKMLCAGRKGKDSCQGDSGGPLVCKIKNQWVQVGIVSFGYGCGRKRFPGVYTRVSSYTDFIKKHTQISTLEY